jgi:hypothetical protein
MSQNAGRAFTEFKVVLAIMLIAEDPFLVSAIKLPFLKYLIRGLQRQGFQSFENQGVHSA